MIKVAIIEDEYPNRQLLKNILNRRFPSIHVVVEEEWVTTAIEKLNHFKPELIFLDVELKKGTGFDVIEGLVYSPIVIFTTAYSQYAVNAIKKRAFDFLLKPIDEEELCDSVKQFIAFQSLKNESESDYMAIWTRDTKQLIKLDDIRYFSGSGAYTHLISSFGKYLISRRIGEIEKQVEGKSFYRIHKQIIVNTNFIERLEFANRNGSVILKNGEKLQLGQRKRKAFLEYIQKIKK